ncbi:MAG: TRAP transporter large permease [Pseudomonadota bacterium]
MAIVCILFGAFFIMMFGGVPIAASLGLAGTLAIYLGKLGIMAFPTNVYAGIAKYPLLAIPMFVLAGSIFDRAGVAARLLGFTEAIIGRGRGSLAVITILVAMIIGGISGSGPACTAAVGGVMLVAMMKNGYPPAFAASVTAAAGSTDILIPPSVAFIVYSVLVPSATVPALFVGGVIPGILACLLLIIPALFLSLRHNFGVDHSNEPKPELWPSFKSASWALAAPVLILGGLRTGWFTPTEAAVMAVFFGLFVGFVIYRTLTLRILFELLIESAETSAVILIVVGLASVFAWATSTLGIVDPIARGLVALGGGHSLTVLIILLVFLKIAGMFLDGISIFLIFCPLFVPIAEKFGWDLVWFGVLMTYVIAMGQFCPPMAVNLMVSCRMTGASMESTVRWAIWLLFFMGIGLALMVFFPWLVLWLPRVTGFM